jgi:hypothetical protein
LPNSHKKKSFARPILNTLRQRSLRYCKGGAEDIHVYVRNLVFINNHPKQDGFVKFTDTISRYCPLGLLLDKKNITKESRASITEYLFVKHFSGKRGLFASSKTSLKM